MQQVCVCVCEYTESDKSILKETWPNSASHKRRIDRLDEQRALFHTCKLTGNTYMYIYIYIYMLFPAHFYNVFCVDGRREFPGFFGNYQAKNNNTTSTNQTYI